MLCIYNVCSFSLYFISSTFFLNHIGLSAPPFRYAGDMIILNQSFVNIMVIGISFLGCVLLVVSQQFNLYRKAAKIIYKKEIKTNNQWLYNMGIVYKATVQLTSFFAFVHDYITLLLALPIVGLIGIGLFKSSFCMENLQLEQKASQIRREIFYTFSYAACISALYFNTFNHIILTILNEAHRLEGQILLFLPNFFFTLLFLVGTSILVLRKFNPRIFHNIENNQLQNKIFSVFSGVCITWKSVINILSLFSLLSLVIAKDDALLILSVPVFIIVSFTQFIFFESH